MKTLVDAALAMSLPLVWTLLSVPPLGRAFRVILLKRQLENLPTSTARAAAIGQVELFGKAEARDLLIAPFSRRPCVFYRCQIQYQYDRGRWVDAWQKDSGDMPFFLRDETGAAPVLAADAEVDLPATYEHHFEPDQEIPVALNEFSQLAEKSGSSRHGTRFLETAILPGAEIYVLGVWQMHAHPEFQNVLTKGSNPSEVFLISQARQTKVLLRLRKQLRDNLIGGVFFAITGIVACVLAVSKVLSTP